MHLGELGEFGLIERITAGIARTNEYTVVGIGDDAAVLRFPADVDVLVTTDMLMEGIHFLPDTIGDRELGYKSVAVSLSDIAAMGGEPRHVFVSLAIPGKVPVERIDDLYTGIKDCCEQFAVTLAGGDTVSSLGGLALSITVVGTVDKGRALLRSAARPGDIVAVTGFLGTSAAGLHYMQEGGAVLLPDEASCLVSAHRWPQPQLLAGKILRQSGFCTSCDDISDGLARELHEIALASHVGIRVEKTRIPVHPAVRNYARRLGVDPLEWALHGGEDYQLLFTAPPLGWPDIEAAFAAHGLKAYWIGTVNPTGNVTVCEPDGTEVPLAPGGFNHFNAPAE